jgi:hypothetical protein
LIEVPMGELRALDRWLEHGRLPISGHDEVLAGPQTRAGDQLVVAGRTLSVVGILQTSIALFAESYLVPADPSLEAVFPKGDESVRHAEVIRLAARQ